MYLRIEPVGIAYLPAFDVKDNQSDIGGYVSFWADDLEFVY